MTSDTTVSIHGHSLVVHKWNCNENKEGNPPRGLVVIYHGFLAHAQYPTVRYAAEVLASAGYAVVAVDLPGHGRSPGIRGYLESCETVINIGIGIANNARDWVPNSENLKLFLVGSSMGGTIALSVADKMGNDKVAGVVLLAPMLALSVSGIEHTLLQGLAFVLPTMPLIPSSSTSDEKQYRDEAKRLECKNDTLTVSGAKLRPASALTVVDMATGIRQRFETITCPFLLLVADEDVVVKKEGSLEFMDKSPSTDKTMKRYPALHGLLCEPSPLFDEIKKDMLDWFEART